MLQHDVTPGPPLSDLDFRAARSTGNLPHEHHEPTLPTPGVCQSAQRQRPDQHKCQQPRRILITWHESGGVLAVLTVLASSVAPFERALLARSSGACVADYYSAVSVSHEACSPVGSFEPAAATASPRPVLVAGDVSESRRYRATPMAFVTTALTNPRHAPPDAATTAGCCVAANKGPSTLFHYTDEAGQRGILKSGQLNPSLTSVSPKGARYGDGQYLSDIAPGSRTCAQLSACFLGIPFQGRRFTNYVEIDVSGLNIVTGRDGVFVNPSGVPLGISRPLVGSGTN